MRYISQRATFLKTTVCWTLTPKRIPDLFKELRLFFRLGQTLFVGEHRFEQKHKKETKDDVEDTEKECRSDTHKKKDFKDDIGTKNDECPGYSQKETDDIIKNASLHKRELNARSRRCAY
jgi:hypothetical protein